MKKVLLAAAFCLCLPALAFAGPRTLVTGVTAYDPDLAWNGFTVISGDGSTKLVDMNGNLVHEWNLRGGNGEPPKVLPGGHVGVYLYPQYNQAGQGQSTFAILDFDSNIVREVNKLWPISNEAPRIPAADDGKTYIARVHHDWEVEGNSVGYYYPGSEPRLDGKLMLLGHTTVSVEDSPFQTPVQLQDDRIFILDENNNIIFDWKASDHFHQFHNMYNTEVTTRLAVGMREDMGNRPPTGQEYNGFDWFHINCASWLGPNKWYDAGDERFHPENIIADSRETSHMFIIDHVTGDIVWQVAPPFVGEDADIGPVYGIHGTHMIPKGLPGEGNIIMFDNGGFTSYHRNELPGRPYSRIVEFDPVTKEVVWEYSVMTAGPLKLYLYGHTFFYSPFISIAQRLPNGNTLITEGQQNRIFEVTPDMKIVWEYINPYTVDDGFPYTYRTYRVPYEWVPQLPKGNEVRVTPALSGTIQIPNDNGEYPNIAPTIDEFRGRRLAIPTPVQLSR